MHATVPIHESLLSLFSLKLLLELLLLSFGLANLFKIFLIQESVMSVLFAYGLVLNTLLLLQVVPVQSLMLFELLT